MPANIIVDFAIGGLDDGPVARDLLLVPNSFVHGPVAGDLFGFIDRLVDGPEARLSFDPAGRVACGRLAGDCRTTTVTSGTAVAARLDRARRHNGREGH